MVNMSIRFVNCMQLDATTLASTQLKRKAGIKITRFSVSEFMTPRTLYEPVSS